MNFDRNAIRKAATDKAKRLVRGDPTKRVDASSWTPPPGMDAETKVGPRPISKRAFKRGGKVAAMEGSKAKHHAGHKPRKSGGKAITANSLINRDVKEANSERDGRTPVGGFKSGGSPKKWIKSAIKHPGALHKELHVKQGEKIPEKKLEKAAHSKNPTLARRANLAKTLKKIGRASGGLADLKNLSKQMKSEDDDYNKKGDDFTKKYGVPVPKAFGSSKSDGMKKGGKVDPYGEDDDDVTENDNGRKSGGKVAHGKDCRCPKCHGGAAMAKGDRVARKSGGRAKGKTNINIVIGHPHSGQAGPPPGGPPPMPPRMPMAGPGGPPPMPPMGGPPGMPPGLPPGLAAAGGGMPPMPPRLPPGVGGPPMSMMPRKQGGRVIRVIDHAAGGGLGRMEKIKAYGATPPASRGR